MALTEQEVGDATGATLGNFVAGRNPDILVLAALWGCMPWRRYNYFANAREDTRGYRFQLARVFPVVMTDRTFTQQPATARIRPFPAFAGNG
ncbi:MAG: hypothetical protein ACYDB8_12480 [Acidiferrobacterales bacterium]